MTWPATIYEYGSFRYLKREIGILLNAGADEAAWDDTKNQIIESILQRGIRRFYSPPKVAGVMRSHEWSFLRPAATIETLAPYSTGTVGIVAGVVTLTGGTWPANAAQGEIVVNGVASTVDTRDSDTQLTLDDTSVAADSGTSYELVFPTQDLPADFADFEGEITYPAGVNVIFEPIKIVSEFQIRRKRQQTNYTYRPEWVGLRPKTLDATTGTRYELLWWPIPDDAYFLTYRYRVNPSDLDGTNKFPYGGQPHYATVLEAVLAEAESSEYGNKSGYHEGRFREQLLVSIEHDQKVNSPDHLGYMRDLSDGPHDLTERRWWWGQNIVTHENHPDA